MRDRIADIRNLKSYCRELDIVVVEKKIDDMYVGMYKPGKRGGKILIDSQMRSDPEKMLYVLAHELGHAIDDMQSSKKLRRMHYMLRNLYTNLRKTDQRVPPGVKQFVTNREKVAFFLGDKVLEHLEISLSRGQKRRLKKFSIDYYMDC